jgi:quinol monooxygenase YgiN
MSFVVTAKWTAKPGEEGAVADCILQLMEPSRAEPGNLFYQAHRDPEDPTAFFFYEQYVDGDAYKAHGESEHFQRLAFGDAIPRLVSRERAFYETWDG